LPTEGGGGDVDLLFFVGAGRRPAAGSGSMEGGVRVRLADSVESAQSSLRDFLLSCVLKKIKERKRLSCLQRKKEKREAFVH